MGDRLSKEYWAGGTWIYHSKIANGAGGGGSLIWEIVPGGGNELEILYGRLFNGDTSSRNANGIIQDDADNNIARVLNVSAGIGAGKERGFPALGDPGVDDEPAMAGQRFIVSGTMVLQFLIAAVAASQDGDLGIACRIRGGIPTVTETGNSTPTITINTERTF